MGALLLPKRNLGTGFFLFLLVVFSRLGLAAEAEFLSVSEQAVTMYDAPSLNAEKLYIASLFLPLEVVVKVEGWVKVRDSSGTLAWVERKFLSDKRYVIVTAHLASIYQLPDNYSPLLFQAQRNVVMEWLGAETNEWVKVRHRDGQVGFVRTAEVWGS